MPTQASSSSENCQKKNVTNSSFSLNPSNKVNSKLSKSKYKKLVFTLYILIVVCIGCATVIEKYRGTPFVGEHIYGAWWFSALWAVLTMAALAYIMEQRLYKRVAVFMLHMSFVVILAGALVTHLFARRGTVCLRTGMAEASYVDKGSRVVQLPFSLTLKEFRIVNYPGTDAPLDYQSVLGYKGLRAQDGEVTVSMNNIGHINGYRLFQQSFDSDGDGVTLGISYDPYGIAITYCGYLMLLVSIIATLLSRHTQMRSLYRKAMKPLLLLLLSLSPLLTQAAPLPSLDPDLALADDRPAFFEIGLPEPDGFDLRAEQLDAAFVSFFDEIVMKGLAVLHDRFDTLLMRHPRTSVLTSLIATVS